MALQPGYMPAGTTTEAVVPDDQRTFFRNRAAWGAIFAGMVTALVLQVLLNMLGLGIGASTLDAWNTGDNPSVSAFSTSAGIFWAVSGIVASLIGGIVAGRLCGSSDANVARWHGFVSWAATTLLVFYLLTSAVGGLIGGAFNALGSTIGGIGKGAASAVSGVAQNTNGDALQAQVRRLVNPTDAQNAQDDVVAYLRASIAGNQSEADAARERAVNSLATAANISPDEARTRLQQAQQQATEAAQTAKTKAQQVAEATRKSVATGSIYGVVALVLGALAAFLGGGFGVPRRETTVVRADR